MRVRRDSADRPSADGPAGARLRLLQMRLLAGSALSAVLAATALAMGGGQPAPVGPAAAPADLGELASRTGCALQPGISTADYRQGACATAGGRIVLLTFTTAQGQQQWKEGAESYGQYLIGPRWAVGGDPALLGRLRGRLGGTLEGTRHDHPS